MITLTLGTNTYITLADAETYHTTYGNVDWTSTVDDEAKKLALVLATQAVDLLYGQKFLSFVSVETQPLLFPRASFYDNDARYHTTYPTSLKNAVCEIALMSLLGADILPMASAAQNVKAESIQVGGISINTQNYKANEGESFEGFRKVDILLRPILRQQGSSWRLKA